MSARSFRVRIALTVITVGAATLAAPPATAGPAGFLTVVPQDRSVSGNTWTPGDTLTITVDTDGNPGNGVLATRTATVDGGSYFNVIFDVDIEPGYVVTAHSDVDDDAAVTVVPLVVTDVDLASDVVTGRGPAGQSVDVIAEQYDDDGNSLPGGHVTVVVSGAGSWTADLGGVPYDVTRLDAIWAIANDAEGDSTTAYYPMDRPAISVSAPSDDVWGDRWLPNTALTLTVDTDQNPGNGYVERITDVVVGPDGAFAEHFTIDIRPGHHVTVDGDVSKHLEVTTLSATIDRTADTVSGTSSSDDWVLVDANEGMDNLGNREDTPDAGGRWTVDFSVPDASDGDPPYDITATTSIGISQWDGNGDATRVSYPSLVGQPGALGFEVFVRADRVHGSGWEPDRTVRVSVDDDGSTANGTLQDVFTSTDELGNIDTDLQYDVRPGNVVTVTDGTSTHSHTVRTLDITQVDRDHEAVTGISDPNASVGVEASDWQTETSAGRRALADGTGGWTIDFSGHLDLTQTTEVAARQFDDDGDATVVVVYAPNPVLSGADRDETATAISQATYGPGEAEAVVLARRDQFADALSGTPFAIAMHAPMLLAATDGLPAATAAEIQRVLDPGRTVYLLGGTAALGAVVADQVTALGYRVERIQGPDRYATAAAIAERVPNPQTALLTTGLTFPDGLAAGAVAPRVGGVVLLTSGDTPVASTSAWLNDHPGVARVAIGGPAARAYPTADPVFGTDRAATALAVANRWFTAPLVVGIARQDDFPDALAGGVHVGWAGGPMLLTPSDRLDPGLRDYLVAGANTIDTAFAYGGSVALSPDVLDEIVAIIGS